MIQDEECESHSFQTQSIEQSTYVCNVSTINDKVDILNQSDMQEMNALIEKLYFFENVLKVEVERQSSQGGCEVESCLSNDDNEIIDPAYYQEASYEGDDESSN